MSKISVVIITFNEENNIFRCIRSVIGLADEIVVVDSYSEDSTVEICKNLGAKVYLHRFEGYREQKNYAASLASFDYVLSLDGDEALSLELYKKLLAIKDNLIYDGYFFNRRNNYCGQWIKHSNWYPDRKLRLFNRKKGQWGGVNPHDVYTMIPGSSTTTIKADILHWVLYSYEEHLEKVNKFSTIAAQEYFKMGKRTSIFSMMNRGLWRFMKAYFFRLGFLDGFNGFVISSLSAYTSFLKYMKLRQLNLQKLKSPSKYNDLPGISIPFTRKGDARFIKENEGLKDLG